jgi:hypothetical protein
MELLKGLEIRQDNNGKWNVYVIRGKDKGEIFYAPYESKEELLEAIKDDGMIVKTPKLNG